MGVHSTRVRLLLPCCKSLIEIQGELEALASLPQLFCAPLALVVPVHATRVGVRVRRELDGRFSRWQAEAPPQVRTTLDAVDSPQSRGALWRCVLA